MDADILRSLLSCNLTEEEALPKQLEEFELADGLVECEVSVYVKIGSLNDNFVSIQDFSMAMSKAWNCKDLRVARVLGPILQVFFRLLQEKECVCGMGGSKGSFFTREVASKIAKLFHGCDKVELRKDKGGKKSFRLGATINLNQPLRSLVNFSVEGGLGVGYLAYERLPYLCFHCGLMGHLIKQFPVIPTGVEPRDVCYMQVKMMRKLSWNLMRMVNDLANIPTVFMGDINEVLHASENVSQRCIRPTWQMDSFRQVVEDCGLVDLGYSRFPFTWSNNFISPYSTRARLDRALASKDWRDYYPEVKESHLTTNTSDHLPLLLNLGLHVISRVRTKSMFRFEEGWCLFDESKDIVQEA
ncbi:hypothetical protein LIER_11822 [Lithospermum erythrorhizon]|uniref:Endonuclease/exonuclease/phosphatase domain-containing protein n=1 Tax=Lithospermum erythrorhizon TaxID=34254 RepID=A0AAV3PRA5_LITER